eukprot:328933_1
MATVAVPRLSFDHDLRQAYSTVQWRLQSGEKSLDGVLDLLRLRIDAETEFTNKLQKIITSSNKLISHIEPYESLRRYGLDALYTDLKNEYTQRMTLLSALKQDVQRPLSSMKEFYHAQNKYFTNQSKQNLKSLKQQQNEFVKLKSKYDKLMTTDKPKNPVKMKQQLLQVKKKFNQQQIIWRKQQDLYDAKITTNLQSMESNEYKRMNTLRDALINWSAFITNLCANRSYDIKDLAESMACINVEEDLQLFMRHALHRTMPKRAQKHSTKFKNKKYQMVGTPDQTQSSNDYRQSYFKSHNFVKQWPDQSRTTSSKMSELSDLSDTD